MDEKSNGHHFSTPSPIKVKIQPQNIEIYHSAPFIINFFDMQPNEKAAGHRTELILPLEQSSPQEDCSSNLQPIATVGKENCNQDSSHSEWNVGRQQKTKSLNQNEQKSGTVNQGNLFSKIQKISKLQLFLEDEEPATKRPLPIPKMNQQTNLDIFQEIQIRQSQSIILSRKEQKSSSEDTRVVIKKRNNFLKAAQNSNLRVLLSQPLDSNKTLSMLIAKSSNALSLFWPQFHLKFHNEQRPLMAAKRTSFKPYSTYLISTNPTDFDQRSSSFLGKVKSNLLGTVVNIFGPGLSPSSARRHHQIPRQLLGTIVYMQREEGSTRRFTLYVKKQQFHYYLAFPQMKLYQPEIPLNQLYNDPTTRDKIDVYNNRRPTLDPLTQKYVLNYRGKVQCPSVRNFILQNEQKEQVILLGKNCENRYNFDISSPMNPLVGFAMGLSIFDELWF